MSDKRVTLELSVEDAEALATIDRGESARIYTEIADAARAALAEHRAGEWERRLGLPWSLDAGGADAGLPEYIVFSDGYVRMPLVGNDRVRLMASAPELARALVGLLEATRHWGECTQRAAALASLAESGWPVPGEE